MVVGRPGGRPAAASSFLPAIFRLSRLFHRRAAALATLSFPPFPIVAKFSPLLTIGIAKPPLPLPLQYLYLIKLSSTVPRPLLLLCTTPTFTITETRTMTWTWDMENLPLRLLFTAERG